MSEAVVTPPVQPPADPPPADVVTMTRTEYEAAITARIGAAVAQATKKQAAIPDAVTKELEELRTAKAEQERKKLEDKGEYQKALDAQAKAIEEKWKPEIAGRDEKLSKFTGRLRREIVTNRLLSAAATGNAVNPDEVVSLLESRVRLTDEFEPEVVDDAGAPRFTSDGKPMTPAQLVEEFLRARPYFVKASGGKPGGAAGGPHAKGAADVTPITEKEAEVKALEAEYARTGSARVAAKQMTALRELKALKATGAA